MIFQILVFLWGLAVGSFVNCLAWRLEHKKKLKKILTGRSFCDHCRRKLCWWENIPIFSWLFLKGRCRTCFTSIPYQYPVIELLTGIIFLGIFISFTRWEAVIFWWLITLVLMVVLASDWLFGIIPDLMVIAGILLTLIFKIFNGQIPNLIPFLLSGIGAFLFFLGMVFLTHGKGMGMGDVKFSFLMGFLLGWPKIFVSLWLAFVAGALGALFLLVLKRKKFSDRMVLGPFLVLGVYGALFYGEILWKIFLPI